MKRARAASHTAPAARTHPPARPAAAAAGSVVRSIFGGGAATAAVKPVVQSAIQLRTLRECTETQVRDPGEVQRRTAICNGGTDGCHEGPTQTVCSLICSCPRLVLPLFALLFLRFPAQSGLVSLLCVVSSSEGEREIQRRDGSTVALSTFSVSDASARLVPLKVWGAVQCAAAGRWRPGDVLLCRGMEVTRFRLAASLSTKAQSVIAVMDTQMMGAERDETTSASAAAEPEKTAAKRRRIVGGRGGGGGSTIGDTGRREFSSARSHLRWNDVRDLSSSTSNWAEICAAARTLWSWAQRVDGHALLGRSNEPQQQPQSRQHFPFASTATATRSGLLGPGAVAAAAAGSNSALPSAIAAPFVSLLSLEGGQLVSVSARLRRFCLLPSSAAAARPNAFGAHAAFASGAVADPPPRAQSLCCVLSQDDEGAELLVEAELRAPRWLTDGRLRFFRGALGRRVRLQAVRVQWSARADALALVDTEHTGQRSCPSRRSM